MKNLKVQSKQITETLTEDINGQKSIINTLMMVIHLRS